MVAGLDQRIRAIKDTVDVLRDESEGRKPALPLQGLSWINARAFLEVQGMRFPSEAEWEYACRAGSTAAFSFGAKGSKAGPYVWHKGNSAGKFQAVGKKLSNAFGLRDMHGNVMEFCEDAWHSSYAGAPKSGQSAWLDAKVQKRVVRGGGAKQALQRCRSSSRLGVLPSKVHPGVGLRAAISLTGA